MTPLWAVLLIVVPYVLMIVGAVGTGVLCLRRSEPRPSRSAWFDKP